MSEQILVGVHGLPLVRLSIPEPSVKTPAAEAVAGNAGTNPGAFSMEGHAHERLTSTTGATPAAPASHTIQASGLSPAIMFTRTFVSEPGLSVTAVKPAAADILLPYYVSDWVTDGGLYVGVIIGWKKLTLANTSATVLSVNVLTGTSAQAVPATGTRFQCVAIARSDMPQ